MTREVTTPLTPEEAVRRAKEFFCGDQAVVSASLEEESDRHAVFNTFRSRIVVAAFPDPEREGTTRVRASTLREDGVVGRLLTYLRTIPTDRPAGS